MTARGSFKSKFGVIAAVGGSVIGLGNIWRFPYIAGENGGGAFLFVYILVSLLIAVPILLSELVIGRRTRGNTFGAFRTLTKPKRTLWPGIGLLGVLTAFMISSFYMVISGWGVEFFLESIMNGFAGKGVEEIQTNFSSFISSGTKPFIYMIVFVIGNYVIARLGIEKGIEKFTKVLMPMMVVLMICLIINSLRLPNAIEGVKFLFYPDFSKITISVILQAVGQAFFSLSLGMGAMITYGSYINKDVNLYRTAATVALCDVTVAILSGLVIFPSVFSFGINPTSGPELVFITLPNIFQQMTGGYFVSILFFFIIIVAAITSSISLIEVITAYISEELKVSRKKAVNISIALVTITGGLCVNSMMPNSVIRIGGETLFDFFDNLTSVYTIPLGGLLISIFTGWFMDKKVLKGEITNYGTLGGNTAHLYKVALFIIKFVAPVVISLIFLDLLGII